MPYRNPMKKKYISSVEKYPLDYETISALNYPDILGGDAGSIYKKINRAPWEKMTEISPFFSIKKISADIRVFHTGELFNLVYFDAFGPEKQPEMWTREVISLVASFMGKNSVFVTYSARGELKRVLKSLGFSVEHLPGPPGKREFTRAIKDKI